MGGFSLIHWIILGLFILLLFGGSRFSSAMKDVAKGLRSFKEGLAEDDKPEERRDPRSLPRSSDHPIDVTPDARRAEEPAPRSTDDR